MERSELKHRGSCFVAIAALCLILLGSCTAWGQYTVVWAYAVGGGGQSAGGPYVLFGSVGCFGWDDLPVTDIDVQFTVQYQGNGRVRIGYSTIHGEAPRSIALNVDLGSATIQSPADVIRRDPAFNGFLDFAYAYPATYVLGAGHPLAKLSAPGVPDFGMGLSQFAINMVCFDEAGNQGPGPMSSADLITLQLHGSGSTTITVDADMTRGCSYVEHGQAVNLPIHVHVTLP